ncbi:hypothetical protein FA95DRAFT_1539854 [Auriscalpium vulgare]|uniref:Uncharacterized protein n=1 Tax=Auriscalpium vulgare TaxID=40419 RepID=A0ACB8RWZ4_9AGAM|nr:hypothetical protein FA95DRAFT_1539854 [Auriscalpium vulgare]
MPPPSPHGSVSHDRATSTPEESAVPSRASSPVPTPRATTPPPSLPSPSLSELGLSLSVLTNSLSPSHFSTPPASGAFLAPHYLLLCHAQGLDVLPLVSPPAPQPYALIRRVSFKSVVVMEHRGVLVAIAGRRDGVRVYALEEVKKAVEWRLDVEIRRERERAKRDEAKKSALTRDTPSMDMLAFEPLPPLPGRGKPIRRSPSAGATLAPTSRTVTPKKVKTPPQTPSQQPSLPPALGQVPQGPPPSYRSSSPPRRLQPQPSAISLRGRDRRTSVSDVLSGTISRRATDATILGQDIQRDGDAKADWFEAHESSDDEAINVVAAGASGSAALDERTSSVTAARSEPPHLPRPAARPLSTATMTPPTRRPRPADLDLTVTRTISGQRQAAPPSPTPTLITLRQALAHSPSSVAVPTMGSLDSRLAEPPTPDGDNDDEDDEAEAGSRTPTNDHLTLAQMLQESRLPDLPPPGSRREQQAILITESHPVASGEEDPPSSPVSSTAPSHHTRQSQDTQTSKRRRRRWSVLDGIFQGGSSSSPALPTQVEDSLRPPPPPPHAPSDPEMRERRNTHLGRSQSSTFSSSTGRHASVRPPTRPSSSPAEPPAPPTLPPAPASAHSRFLSRIIGNAFARRSEDSTALQQRVEQVDNGRRGVPGQAPPHAPAPKLEYVKLPGTKNSMLIKAVETSKKSFLAILCGENGEKVELFAGTYRTALGLSRTFILPDSPRSLELQLQGDDLVEVFLVFSQNVFGLEPATVRVREVRLGRAERRAARRRARELQSEDPHASGAEADPVLPTDETSVSVTVGLTVPNPSPPGTDPPAGRTPANRTSSPTPGVPANAPSTDPPTPQAKPDEVTLLATAAMGPYTTFQQLTFSPNFPLASIADDYVIPPTYPEFLHYRSLYEPDVNGNGDVDLSQVQFSPPGLPLPPPAPPSKWFYRDPKGVIHGPWKSSLMTAWYRDGLLPPDLPVRREEEPEYTLLKDLRQHSVDPTQPFGITLPRPPAAGETVPASPETGKPLLAPISLLTQSRIFGPPALFFSSRGGHSTAIVDGRGRSVLKDRFVWSPEELDDDAQPVAAGRLGDVKRLEAFDVQDRSVLVAMRQGGFEAVDLGDALLRPADASRSELPHFTTTTGQVNRRGPFVWRIGMPVSSASSGPTSLLPPKSTHHTRMHTPTKKLSTGPGKSPGRMEFSGGEVDSEHTRDEVIFLGRRDDNIYLCERNGGVFRVLRLAPTGAM